MGHFESLIEKCDALIRGGRPGEASKLIGKLNHSRIPREWRLAIAKIARRCGAYASGLKVLSKILTNEKLTASPAELAEYGVLLIRMGAVAEGFSRLQSIDTKEAPEAWLYRAFGHFGRWEYDEAVPLLEDYLKSPLSDYARLVGTANLAFAYVETRRHGTAEPLLEELIARTQSEGHPQLFTNCKALKAQIYLQEQKFDQAARELESAHRIFPLSEINDHFLVTKLHLILTGLREQSAAPLQQLNRLAADRCDWVSVREAELFSLKVDFDEARFQSLIFGTAYPRFRERVLQEFGRAPGRSLYVLGPKAAPRFDIRTGHIDGHPALKPGAQVHQAIETLLRDFYEPHRIAGLFGALFPEEKFNVATSAVRVRKVLQRTRQWFVDEKIPVSIREQSGFYSLQIDGNFSFLVPLERVRVDNNILQFEKFKSAAARADSFSNQDIREHLGLSTTAAQSLLNWAIDNGQVLKLGGSKRDTRYKIRKPG